MPSGWSPCVSAWRPAYAGPCAFRSLAACPLSPDRGLPRSVYRACRAVPELCPFCLPATPASRAVCRRAPASSLTLSRFVDRARAPTDRTHATTRSSDDNCQLGIDNPLVRREQGQAEDTGGGHDHPIGGVGFEIWTNRHAFSGHRRVDRQDLNPGARLDFAEE